MAAIKKEHELHIVNLNAQHEHEINEINFKHKDHIEQTLS